MAIWRPANVVQVKVLGLAWRGERLLAAEVEADDGRVTGVRPLGGAVEFGETREEALRREFREELDVGIRIVGPWHAFENIYQHEGRTGHEFIFVADIELDQTALYEMEIIRFDEGGVSSRARWFGPAEMEMERIELYPTGLQALLARNGRWLGFERHAERFRNSPEGLR